MKAILIRTLSGAVFVATILLPLLFIDYLFPFVIAGYALLIIFEYIRLIIKIRNTNTRSWLRNPCFSLTAMLIWIILPMTLLAIMPVVSSRFVSIHGAILTLAMFVLVWTHDTFAFLTGRLLGKHPLFPRISPAKTVEGALGGFFFTIIAAILVYYYTGRELPLLFWVGAVLIVVIAGTLGDLTESRLKRMAGAKDSGYIMPGHGGIFDRFDAILFVVPCWLLWLRVIS